MFKTHTPHPGNQPWPKLAFAALLVSLLLAIPFGASMAQTTYNPVRYWTFNGTNSVSDSMGIYNLNFTAFNSPYTIENNGRVGKFLTLSDASGLVDGGALSLNNAVSIEFLIKPGAKFNTSKIMQRADDAFSIRMEYSRIIFSTTHKNTSGANVFDEFIIDLNGIGRKSYGYYVDNLWHHMVFKFDGATGVKEVWVDGQLPTGFSKTVATGTFPTGSPILYFNHTIGYVKYLGSLDEIAIYNTAIPASLIYKHYLGIQSSQPYNFTNNYAGTIPAAAPITGSIDPAEFAPGHPNVTVSGLDQTLSFPSPRYKTGHTLLPNVPLYGIEYLGGIFQPGVSLSMALNVAKVQQPDLINNFNQSIMLISNTSDHIYMGDTTKFSGWFLQYANQNPSKHTTVFSFWPQLNPTNIGKASSSAYVNCNCLSNNHYLRNSSGQFLDVGGNVTNDKYYSPAGPSDSLVYDGLTQRFYLQSIVNRLTRPLNLIFENGETLPFYNNPTALSKDPAVLADKNNSGLDWYTYEGRRAKEKILTYRNQFMNISQLANTKFAFYQVDGQSTYRFKYEEMRQTSTPINGQNYPTGDIYMRFPDNWRYWSSAWHGWQWVAESRKVELANGDKLFSPAVAAGWDNDETKNVRPAQWLGMLKAFSMAGAEYFYTSFFSLNAPWQDPKNWAWQVVMPAYAQGISSHYEEFFRNGFLMEGDVPNSYSNPLYNAYSFKAGDLRKLVVIRKHNTLAKYAITGTLQPNSNMMGNAENSGIAVITLDGQTLKFQVRRQGSTYIYDKTNAASPVFYQLDGWHEAIHPYSWSRDFNFEAELFDNANANAVIKTAVPAGTVAGDYTNYTSYVTFNANSDIVFNFLPRKNAPTTQYLWVRARSKDGSSAGFTAQLNNGTVHTFDCIRDTNWVWYRYNTSNAAVVFNGLTTTNNQLKITALNTKIEIDKISITSNSGAAYGNAINACTGAQATITANGPTTFCQGGSVNLSASPGSSYLWSNGATAQTITVTNSGTYTVTVTTNGIGTSTSSPVTVTANVLPTATISAGSSTTFCQGGSVTLTASAGSSYLWSPGNQTTQSITVTTAGSYNVRVTSSNGCSKTSPNTSVVVNSLPSATVSASGPLTFCQGSNVTLTASAGSAYLWSPGNQTTQSISVTTGGTYSVRVTNSSGCSMVSSNTVVTVNSSPTANITASGPLSIPAGSTVTLTASAGSSYLWLPGNQTSQSITVGTSGSYTVRVTNSSGCSTTSAAATVTVGTAGPATISTSGHTSFCQGGSVTLTASNGTSYLWSTGATTKSIVATTTGNYSVTVYNGATPSVSSPVSVTVWPLPTATITANNSTTVCMGTVIQLSANTASSYYWTPGGQTSNSIFVSSGGTYNVFVTDANGCTKAASAVPVVVYSCASCDAPYGLVTNSVTATTATLSWMNPNAGQTQFQVKVKNLTTGAVYVSAKVPATTTTMTVPLSAGTNYRWWVRSWCGSFTRSVFGGYLPFSNSLVRVANEGDADPMDDNDLFPEDGTDPSETITLNENEVQIFPNPASTSASISFKIMQNEKLTLSLMEANGKLISTDIIEAVEGFNIHDMDLSQLPKGLYMVQLTGNGYTATKRLAVQ